MAKYLTVSFDKLLSGYCVTYTSPKSDRMLRREFVEADAEKARQFARERLEAAAQIGWVRLYVGDATALATAQANADFVVEWTKSLLLGRRRVNKEIK